MRISDSMLQSNFLSNLNNSKEKMQKLQTQVASNNKVNNPSDSPSGAAKIMRFNANISQTKDFIKNVDNSTAFLQESIRGLEYILDETTKVLVNLTEVENPRNDSNLNSFADQIDASLNIILESANTEFNGQFVFGGTDDSQSPYGYSDDNSAIELKVDDVSGERKVKISKNITQKLNVTGSDLFGNLDGTDIFNKLIEIRDNLRNGIKPTDEDVQTIEDFSTSVRNHLSEAGNVSNKLDASSEILSNQVLTLEDLVSKEREVDLASAMIDLQNYDYSLQLSYKMSSMFLAKSILDYI
jgi:flagellar hook-associated protein 3 FlgL